MAFKYWNGYRQGIFEFSRGNPWRVDFRGGGPQEILTGDTLTRSLVAYQFYTHWVPTASVQDQAPWPVKIALLWTPVPDGEPSFDPGSAGGDALLRDVGRWVHEPLVDAAGFRSRWVAQSPGFISVSGPRTVADVGAFALSWIASQEEFAPEFPSGNYIDTHVYGWVWWEGLFVRKV